MTSPIDLAVTDSDTDLERRIERATLAMLSARSSSERRGWHDRMEALVARRTPEMVERVAQQCAEWCGT